MEGYKLRTRTEDMQWAPPILAFDIERHAQQSGDSTRAVVHTWSVNTETSEASIVNARQRYIGGMDKPLKVGPLAEEVVKLILNRANDPRLRGLSDTRVKIATRKFIPKTNWRTTKGRTERFQTCVVQLLGEDWKWCKEPWHRDEIENTNSVPKNGDQ
jgi:hypothetical protein